MKYAFNNNGILQDVVMTDPFLLFPAGYAEQFIEVPDEAFNGWLWDGETATEPPVPEPLPVVVTSITPRQARLALLALPSTETAPADAPADWTPTYPTLLAQVEAAFAQLPEPQKTAASIEWEYASAIERGSPLVAQFGPILGLTEEQIDDLFAQAATL